MKIQIGDIFDQRYEILALLGSGGIGVVYKALQLDCKRLVALKVLHEHIADADDVGFRERFFREARALSQLSHLNILKVYHLGETFNGTLYLAMEYLQGRTLREILREHGSLPLQRSINIVRDAARALYHVHQHGIVHRDIKPENIVIVALPEPDTVKIVDFGLVRLLQKQDQKLTETGFLVGTSSYMSPEQCLGQVVDYRSDIYALTICFFELITGGKPFDADSSVGLLYKHINEPVPLVRADQVDSFHSSINTFISKGMAKDASQRFASMEEMASELDSLSNTLQAAAGALTLRRFLNSLTLISILFSIISLAFFVMPHRRKNALAPASDRQAKFLQLRHSAQIDTILHECKLQRLDEAHKLADSFLRQNTLSVDERIAGLYLCSARRKLSSEMLLGKYYFSILDLYERSSKSGIARSVALRTMAAVANLLHERGLSHQALLMIRTLESELQANKNVDVIDLDSYVRFSRVYLDQEVSLKARLLYKLGKTDESSAIIDRELAKGTMNPPALVLACLDCGEFGKSLGQIDRAYKSVSLECEMCEEFCARAKMLAAKKCLALAFAARSIADPRYQEKIQLLEATWWVESGNRDKALSVLEATNIYQKYYREEFASLLAVCGRSSESRKLLQPDKAGGNKSSGSVELDTDIVCTAASYYAAKKEPKIFSRSQWLSCLSLYALLLSRKNLTQESLRVADEALADLEKNGLPGANPYFAERDALSLKARKIFLLSRIGKITEAKEVLQHLQNYSLKDDSPWIDIFSSAMEIRSFKQAKELAQRCNVAAQLCLMARCCYSSGQFDLALLCLNRAEQSTAADDRKTKLTIEVERAFFLLEQGDIKSASTIAKNVYSLNLGKLAMRDRLAVANELLCLLSFCGMRKEAEEELHRLLLSGNLEKAKQ